VKTWSIAPVPRLPRSLLALVALGAASCARHRPKQPPGGPGAGDLAFSGVSGAEDVSLAVVPPYTNERCRDGRVFIAGGATPGMTVMDLPCFERGACASATQRTTTATAGAASAGGRVLRLADYSILQVRVGRLEKAGRSVGAAFLARSTDCGDTWTASTVDAGVLGADAAGAWDRLTDAIADPWDPRGLVYLAVDVAAGGARRAVVVWSNDRARPSSWRAQALVGRDAAPDARLAMAAPAAGRLYLLDVAGTSPRLTPVLVDPAAGTLSALPSWYVFQSHGGRTAAAEAVGWEDAAAPGSSVGLAATGRLAGADHLTAVYQSGRAARVMDIEVTGASAVSSVTTTSLMTASSDQRDGTVARATLVEGPPGSLTAAVSWEDEEAASGRARARWAGLAADPRTLASARVLGPAPLSTDAKGAPRAWDGGVARGAVAPGAAYRGSGGFAGFLLPWLEGRGARALHVRAARVALAVPWEHHVFDDGSESWYTDGGDWAVDHFKGDCSSSAVVVGLSAYPTTGSPHSILCHDHLIPMLAASSVPVDFSDDSRSRDSLPDWDTDYFKGECADDEAVTGVSRSKDGKLTAIRCTRMGGGFHRNRCAPRPIEGEFSRGSMVLGDWAPYVFKGQCIAGQVVKGVSRTRVGSVHSILCCYVSVL
jgi:hypothetical protein